MKRIGLSFDIYFYKHSLVQIKVMNESTFTQWLIHWLQFNTFENDALEYNHIYLHNVIQKKINHLTDNHIINLMYF